MKKFLLLIFICLISSHGLIFSQQKVWSLEECIRYAIDNNIQIKQQAIQTEVLQNSLDLSKMKLLPSLNGQASHDYSFGRALDQNTYQFYNQTLLSDYFYLGGSTTVFNGLQNYNSIQKNKYAVLAGKEDLQNISDNVALNVALAYLQILLNKELVAANENQLNITLQQIEKTKKLVDAGSVAKGNLLQIEAQAASEELSLINIKNMLETSYLNITQLLELKTPGGFEIVVPEISVDPNSIISGNIDEIYQIAEKNRPEIKSSQLKLTASEYDLKIAQGARSPRLSLNHSLNTRYTYISNQPGIESFKTQIKNNKNSGIGLTMSIPILNGWQVNKNISNSKLSVENSQYSLEGTRKQLYKNIQQAYTDAVASLKKFNSSIKAVTSTEESFRYTEQKFNVGMVTSVDYNAAKTQLLKAQSDMAQAKYEYVFKTKVLDFYKGIPLNLNK
ncbi:MAG: TolC family protein [Bacteroidetes bacterium]|nr:MAG: TolC family protein [Bacteroidota bacterium]